CQQDYTTFTF
nr:immunoglobulin light chain junction region [Macaca mulatta]MOX84703.1 immunoglobulin light chain junction region [Macaca mulatta]MOX84857.1 immunoglobulin light chain junction region [Macaca mulatta]MOX85264.1 immunoglobulin light chain junction region [Macaca mulatta]MOX85360.1 immunoglobulin light chain junction region [Macaca mulatta]